MVKIKVTLSTEDGEVLDQLTVAPTESMLKDDPSLSDAALQNAALSNKVSEVIGSYFEIEED